jgi:hypothetical protein
MTEAADLVAQLRAIDEKARAAMAGPLAELEALPDPPPDPPVSGCDPSKVDWDKVITTPIYPGARAKYRGCVIDARIHKGTDVEFDNVHITAGAVIPTSPRPVLEIGEGSSLSQVTIEPRIRSVMWSEGVRTGRLFHLDRVHVKGTVDGITVVTPTGLRTLGDIIDLLVEDLPFYDKDPNHTDGTHNDAIQFSGPISGVTLLRPILRPGLKATSCIMANVPTVEDFYLRDGQLTGARSGVNFGNKAATGARNAIIGTIFDTPTDVYAPSTLWGSFRFLGNTHPDGTAAVRRST